MTAGRMPSLCPEPFKRTPRPAIIEVVSRGDDNVIDLQHWRAQRRPQQPPGDALEAVDAAALVYEALTAQGHEVRFELPETDGGRVRAELRSVDGDVVRTVALYEVVGFDDPDDPAVA